MLDSEYMPDQPLIHLDPRFTQGLALFGQEEYGESADAFEELFFEAIGDEVQFVRFFLQVSTGFHHLDRGTPGAAIERLEHGIIAGRKVTNWRGFDGPALIEQIEDAVRTIRSGRRPHPPPLKPAE